MTAHRRVSRIGMSVRTLSATAMALGYLCAPASKAHSHPARELLTSGQGSVAVTELHRGKSEGNDDHGAADFVPVPTAAPEIDPASAISGLTLLLGGLTVLRARRSMRPNEDAGIR